MNIQRYNFVKSISDKVYISHMMTTSDGKEKERLRQTPLYTFFSIDVFFLVLYVFVYIDIGKSLKHNICYLLAFFFIFLLFFVYNERGIVALNVIQTST
jgi:glucan phosphoethanolaminetransferase (alkaline phosphatase superfamily)